LFSLDIIHLIGYGLDKESQVLSSNFLKILILTVLFSVMGTLLTFVYHSYKSFIIPAIGRLVEDFLILIVIVFFYKTGTKSIAMGTILGVFCSFLLKCPIVIKHGFKYIKNVFIVIDRNTKRIFMLALPLVFGVSVFRINMLVDRFIASTLPEGSISSLNYGYQLISLCLGIFSVPLASVIFPLLSESVAKNLKEYSRDLIIKGMEFFALILIPISILFFLFNRKFISLIYQRGNFDCEDLTFTAQALAYYSVGLFLFGFGMIIQRAYFAIQETKTLSIISVTMIGLNLIFDLILVQFLGLGGIALATSLVQLVWIGILIKHLNKKIGKLFTKEIYIFFSKIILASLIGGIITFSVSNYFYELIIHRTFLVNLAFLSFLCIFALLIYLLLITVMKVKELIFFWDILKEFFTRNRKKIQTT